VNREVNLSPGRRIIATQTMHRAILTIVLPVLLLAPLGALGQNAAPPDPMTLRTRDAHQGLTIVADPFLKADRYSKDVFGKNSFYNAGMVAIDVYFRNDNDSPIRLNPETIELVTSPPGQDRQRLGNLSPEDVADRTLLTANSNVRVRRPFPFPNPTNGPGHNKDWVEMTNTLHGVALGTDILPPHATTHGFLFFDMNHDFGAVRYSHLFIPDLTFMTDKKALFFFEIDLADAPSR
jgi:hypothetical protein